MSSTFNAIYGNLIFRFFWGLASYLLSVYIVQTYKDYRGKENSIYYSKIKACADKLSGDSNDMQLWRDIVNA